MSELVQMMGGMGGNTVHKAGREEKGRGDEVGWDGMGCINMEVVGIDQDRG